MSKDFSPIEHIMVNLHLKATGTIKELLMEHPYIEFTGNDGKIIPLVNKECSERYPYVTFFTNLHHYYETERDNPVFTSELGTLENRLRTIVEKMETEVNKARASGRPADLTKAFTDAPDHIKQYILAEGDYSFSYDHGEACELFTRRCMDDIREKTIHHIAACAIAEFEKYLTNAKVGEKGFKKKDY